MHLQLPRLMIDAKVPKLRRLISALTLHSLIFFAGVTDGIEVYLGPREIWSPICADRFHQRKEESQDIYH